MDSKLYGTTVRDFGSKTAYYVYREFDSAIKAEFQKQKDWPDFMRAVVLHEFAASRLKLVEFNRVYEALSADRRKAELRVTDEVALQAFVIYVYKHYCKINVYHLYEFLKYGMKDFARHARPIVLWNIFDFYICVHYSFRRVGTTEETCYLSYISNRHSELPEWMKVALEEWKGTKKNENSFDFGISEADAPCPSVV
ncbi:ORF23 [Ranid herpesvirus 2]|uniref:ORF23 n=1 Tax=Ranid herpesvirus 2 TaxID=389214 RepID=Q14W83_9VIRU|nr:ORF23 [Ranid herpesvirus 2]ABG25682.1 ORF23 [Ranid herpesvirus 2]